MNRAAAMQTDSPSGRYRKEWLRGFLWCALVVCAFYSACGPTSKPQTEVTSRDGATAEVDAPEVIANERVDKADEPAIDTGDEAKDAGDASTENTPDATVEPVSDALADTVKEGVATEPPSPKKYPLDHLLRLNHIQVKGTHNSYHIAPKTGVIAWKYTHANLDVQLDKQGVRQFELDLYWDIVKKRFEVYHIPVVDEGSNCRLFTDCLKTLKMWSDQHKDHIPIMILIEPKGIKGYPNGDVSAIEKEILQVWPKNRILTPDRLRGTHRNVREAVRQQGWPTLGQVRGTLTFLILLEGKDRERYTYGGKNLHNRLMFTIAEPGAPYGVMFSINDPLISATQIQKLVKDGFLVRTRSDSKIGETKANNDKKHSAALRSGAQWLSTDYPARVPSTRYVAIIPGGTPARCNPLVAPKECTSQAIEDLP